MSSYNYGNINLTTGYGSDIDWANLSTISIGAVGGYTGGGYLTTATGSNGSWYSSSSQAKVSLTTKGVEMDKDCDITIGNWSLKSAIDKIEQRLAILNPNPKLEAEWEELKELGDRYRELEREIEAKMKTWDILKRED